MDSTRQHTRTRAGSLAAALVALLLASVPCGAAAQTRDVRPIVFGNVVSVASPLCLVLDEDRKVQLIGVDLVAGRSAGETREFAREATAVLESLATGQRIWMEFDDIRTMPDGRLLAYVYRSEDGLLLNAEMIRRGFGSAITKAPYRMLREFRALDATAREGFTGLWAKLPPPPDPNEVAASVGGVRVYSDGTVREEPLELTATGATVTSSGAAHPAAAAGAESEGANAPFGPNVAVTDDGVYHAQRHIDRLQQSSRSRVRYRITPLAVAQKHYRPCDRCSSGQ